MVSSKSELFKPYPINLRYSEYVLLRFYAQKNMKNVLESCHFLCIACNLFEESLSQMDIIITLTYYDKNSSLENHFLIRLATGSFQPAIMAALPLSHDNHTLTFTDNVHAIINRCVPFNTYSVARTIQCWPCDRTSTFQMNFIITMCK